jgi:hypothetical protein
MAAPSGDARRPIRTGDPVEKLTMYPVRPIELVMATVQFVCYFFTVLALLLGMAIVR